MDTKKLRQKILDLAIRGKLVPQDPSDEHASVLLERIRVEKERLIKEGKIKHSRKSAKTSDTHHYENVPFELPQGWVWCKLDDLAFYKKGPFGSSLTKSMFVSDSPDAYKVYEQKNAISKDATLGHYFIDKEKYEELKGFTVQSEDIIVSCAGTIGETYVLPGNIRKGIINQALMLIRLFDKSISDFYLLYFDFILKSEAAKESKGTAIKNIPPFEILKNFYIPLPPIEEQRKIIEKVSYWISLINTIDDECLEMRHFISQTQSKILDLAIRGRLVPQDPNDEPASELLRRINPKAKITCDNEHSRKLPQSWCFASLKNIFAINPRNKAVGELVAGFVSMANICDNFTNKFSYEQRNWNEIKSGFTHFQDGDIAVAKISPCLENRKSVLIRNLPNGLGAGTTELYVFRSKHIYSLYALYYFKSDYFIQQCIGSLNGVVGQQRVNREIIKNLKFPLPPISEQKRIVKKIEELFERLKMIEEAL